MNTIGEPEEEFGGVAKQEFDQEEQPEYKPRHEYFKKEIEEKQQEKERQEEVMRKMLAEEGRRNVEK